MEEKNIDLEQVIDQVELDTWEENIVEPELNNIYAKMVFDLLQKRSDIE